MKKVFMIAALLVAMAIPTQAQILTMDGEDNTRAAGELVDEFGRIPYHGVEYDQYNAIAPLGEGVLLLGLLGGAYLIGRRRKENQ